MKKMASQNRVENTVLNGGQIVSLQRTLRSSCGAWTTRRPSSRSLCIEHLQLGRTSPVVRQPTTQLQNRSARHQAIGIARDRWHRRSSVPSRQATSTQNEQPSWRFEASYVFERTLVSATPQRSGRPHPFDEQSDPLSPSPLPAAFSILHASPHTKRGASTEDSLPPVHRPTAATRFSRPREPIF